VVGASYPSPTYGATYFQIDSQWIITVSTSTRDDFNGGEIEWVVLHEYGHILHRHPVGRTTPEQELMADRYATERQNGRKEFGVNALWRLSEGRIYEPSHEIKRDLSVGWHRVENLLFVDRMKALCDYFP